MRRSEIRENRLKWINFLMLPDTVKTVGMLDDGHGRCCLGHGAYVLGLSTTITRSNNIAYGHKIETSTAPEELMDLVGLWTEVGSGEPSYDGSYKELFEGQSSLAAINDATIATPQEIGAYLLSVIEGGKDTPFKPLSSYEE